MSPISQYSFEDIENFGPISQYSSEEETKQSSVHVGLDWQPGKGSEELLKFTAS